MIRETLELNFDASTMLFVFANNMCDYIVRDTHVVLIVGVGNVEGPHGTAHTGHCDKDVVVDNID